MYQENTYESDSHKPRYSDNNFTGSYNQEYTSLNKDSLRANFVRKVLTIVGIQLAFTTLFSYMTINSNAFRAIAFNSVFMFFSVISTLVLAIALNFSTTLRTKVPLNYILLGVFTLGESHLVGAIVTQYEPKIVFMALLLTTLVVAGLATYSYRTKKDISYFAGLIFMISFAVFGMAIVSLFTTLLLGVPILTRLMGVGSAALAGLYFIYDLKLIVG